MNRLIRHALFFLLGIFFGYIFAATPNTIVGILLGIGAFLAFLFLHYGLS